MLTKRASLTLAICLLIAVALPGSVYYLLRSSACITETKMTLTNVAGADFEVTYADCDTLAKEEFVNVYISESETSSKFFWNRWRNKKTLLFQYDPDDSLSLPTIKTTGPKKISISVSRVSSVLVQKKQWEHLSVDYEIGSVEYP